jgi:hypothetical protein
VPTVENVLQRRSCRWHVFCQARFPLVEGQLQNGSVPGMWNAGDPNSACAVRHSSPKIIIIHDRDKTTPRHATPVQRAQSNVGDRSDQRHVRAAREPRHEGAGSQLLPKDHPHLGCPHLQPQRHIAMPQGTHRQQGHAPKQSGGPYKS